MEGLVEWEFSNVFVTGGSGFLGSYLLEQLADRGANVVALVRDQVPRSRLFYEQIDRRVTLVKGDLRDFALLERVLNEYEIDTVFHLAAQTIVQIAHRNPLSTFDSNIRGSWNLFEACRRSELIERVLVASSDKAYGEKEELPYFEDDSLDARHPYDMSKAFTDLMAQSYFHTYGLPVGITRCGNLYGGGDLNFNRIVPQTIKSLLFDKPPVLRSDGTFLRDYFYVEDAAESYIVLAEQLLEKNLQGEAFNFGTETPTTVLEVVNKLIEISGKTHLSPVIQNTAKGEIKAQWLGCKKAREVLEWKPRHSLEEGLKKSYQWYGRWFGKS